VDTFPEALYYALREDPDVIMVGEIRDLETMRTGLAAAETGHLVIATLHAVDTVGAIDRMIAMFPVHEQDYVRIQLSLCLRAVVAQRLLPNTEGNGRVLAAELLLNTPAVASGIRMGQPTQVFNALDTGQAMGMVAFDQSLVNLATNRHITSEMALRMARNQKKVQEKLVRVGMR